MSSDTDEGYVSLPYRDIGPAATETEGETDLVDASNSLSLSVNRADDADDSLFLRQERRNRERQRTIDLRAMRPRKNMRVVAQQRLARKKALNRTVPLRGAESSASVQLTGDIDDDDIQSLSFLPGDDDDAGDESEGGLDGASSGCRAEPHVPEWRQVSMHAKLFDDAQETETSTDPKYCFFCDCLPNRLDQEGSIRYKYLRSFVEDSWGQVDPVWLINKAQELYNQGLRPYTRLKLPWYRSVIYAHFTEHHPTMRFMLEAQLQTYMGVLRTIEENNMVEQNNFDPNRKRVNLQYADMYMKYCKEMRCLYRTLMETRSQNVASSRV